MSILSSLNREQKESVGLLLMGTFLEYFDLMLYVHMAVLLNELFFPKTDPHTASLLTSLAFCSTFVLRPIGALIFGYIGDNIGRKTTVIMTTMMMSISCVIMANLPTYAEIGITAAWVVTICRMVQGMSSMGEIIGCQIYVSEITKPPEQYPAVSLIGVSSSLGAVAALGISSLVTTAGFNWRIAFWIGAGIAVIGSFARLKLRETPEFIDMKRKLQRDLDKKYKRYEAKDQKASNIKTYIETCKKEKINKTTLAACFLIQCGWPFCFYLGYMYFNPFLKKYGYSAGDIIFHNFILSIIMLASNLVWGLLSYRFHPLKIIKGKAKMFSILVLFLPFIVLQSSHPYQIFVLQALLFITFLGSPPADSILIKIIPVFKRFTTTSFLYALSRALIYVITSLGFVYLTEAVGHYGVWVLGAPFCIGFIWAANHFEKLESDSGALPKQKDTQYTTAVPAAA
jgi:MHS family proline/betaine transporter-like MFS transporter